jgi:hypothetical protein
VVAHNHVSLWKKSESRRNSEESLRNIADLPKNWCRKTTPPRGSPLVASGPLRRRTYLVASIDPGEHHLCAIGPIGLWSYVSLYELNAKARETY